MYLNRCSKVELPPVQVSPLSYHRMIREGVTQEVDVLPCDLAGENVAVLLLSATEELEGVGSELQSTAQVRDEAVLHHGLTGIPKRIIKTRGSKQYSAPICNAWKLKVFSGHSSS